MGRSLEVLTIGNMYPPHHFGGYELVWRSAVEHLRGCGMRVRVLTTDFRTDSGAPDDPGVSRELRWYWRDHAFPRLGWRARRAIEAHNGVVLERHLEEVAPDVVMFWAMGGMSLTLIERVHRAGLPALAFVHDDWLDYGRRADAWTRMFAGRPRAAAAVERLVGLPTTVDLERAARYLFVSETTRGRARASGLEPLDSSVAHSGIAGDIEPAPAQEWRWRLLYVGRLDPRKGVATAIDALASLPAESALTVAGEGDPSEREGLEQRAAERGVAHRVRFVGARSRPEIHDLYAEADAVVFPVLWEEPWGLVPLEAMAAGRPVVASGMGGSAEYLRDEENCLLFPAGDARRLAASLERVAGDPALRTRLAEEGLETASRHTEARFNATVAEEVLRAAGGVAPAPAPLGQAGS